jgi:signal transduction histidine kinase
MSRIRLAVLVAAAAVLVPLVLLVRTALLSAGAERDLQHRVVADRIADEMERELTALLHREEERPFAHYRFAYVPEPGEAPGQALVRSPLASPPEEPFLLGWFQVDPDGTVSSPLRPSRPAIAAGLAGPPPTPEAEAAADLIEAAVAGLWSGRRLRELAAEPEAGTGTGGPTPGSTVPLETAGAAKRKKQPAGPEIRESPRNEEAEETDAARAAPKGFLEQLNRAVGLRGERQEKASQIEQVQSANLDEDTLAEEVAGELAEDAAVEARAGSLVPGESASRDLRGEPRASPPPADRSQTPSSPRPSAEPAPKPPTVDVRLEPMVGQGLGGDYMVLYRTVLVGDRAYRQGLVLDIPELLAYLERRVLAAGDLAGRARVLPADTDRAELPVYAFRHRFADPFGPVTAILALEPLPGVGGRTWIVALSLLLVLAAAAGLAAVYRMVSVVVAYAERRNNFVSAVTHELKTPLTAIRMVGEMLRDGIVPDEARRQHYYETLTAEGERLSRLLDNVLELSRLERRGTENKPLELRAGDLGTAVTEAVSVLRPHAEKLGFGLRVQTEEGLPPVLFERDALRQVIFNLVDNALKYSREAAGKTIEVRCRAEGEGVAVAVADRGPGVERRHLEHIFEPFYRGGDELTRTAQGTGIGLALVRGLVERMGGRVRGRNRPGGGFEVSVWLPRVEVACRPSSVAKSPHSL